MINYIFEIDVKGEKTQYSDVVLTSGDKRAARFTFCFKDGKEPFETEGLILLIKAKRADGSIITDAGFSDSGRFHADIKNSMTEVPGELSFEIALSGEDGSLVTVSEIICTVRKGYGEEDLKAYDTTPVLATLSSRALSAENSAISAKKSAEEAVSALQEAKVLAENYKYITKHFTEHQLVSVVPNAVTYIYGALEDNGWEEIHFACVEAETSTKNLTEEYVLILDFTNMTSVPTIIFDNNIKWINGEPPEMEAEKVYMFSFTKIKSNINTSLFCLGIGGEFA